MEQNQTNRTETINGEITGMVPADVHQAVLWVQMVVGVVILAANILTLLSLTRARQLQLSLRVLLGNMAIADSTVGLIFIFNCIVFYQPQILNVVTCFIRYGTINTSICVSMLNVTLLALDRCFTIKFPFLYPQWASFKGTALIVLVSWVIAVILAIVVYQEKLFQARVCLFLEVVGTAGFVVPGSVFFTSFTVVIVCYVFIAKDIRRHIRQIAQTTYTIDNSLSTIEKTTNNPFLDNTNEHSSSNANESINTDKRKTKSRSIFSRNIVEPMKPKATEGKPMNSVKYGSTSAPNQGTANKNFDDDDGYSTNKQTIPTLTLMIIDTNKMNSSNHESQNRTNTDNTPPTPSTSYSEDAVNNKTTAEKHESSESTKITKTEAPIFITTTHDRTRRVAFSLPIPLHAASALTVPQKLAQATLSITKPQNPPQATSSLTVRQNSTISRKVINHSMKKYFAATKTVTIILAVFFGCNSPLCVYLLHLAVHPELIDSAAVMVNSMLFCMVLNSLANPIIYTWKMKQLRKGFLLFFCKNRCSDRIVNM